MLKVRKWGFRRTILFVITICLFSFPLQAQYGGGTGESNSPYLIYTAEQMNEIGLKQEDWGKHFKLMADIDLSEYSGDEFNIIGECFYESFWIIRPFTGIFNGNGHTISNFIYTSTDTNYIGLFGYVGTWGKEALIKDLGLIDPNIAAGAGDYVGSLIGELRNGTVTGCYVEGGSVSGDESVGGLVGAYGDVVEMWNMPPFTISNCCSTSSVQGTWRVGGLVGSNYEGRIINSFATGKVSGNQSVGGLVGQNGRGNVFVNMRPIPGTIINCYSTGHVSGESNVGGLLGLYIEGPVIGCFWDIEASGQAESAGGEGKTTAEMQMESTFIEAGWDFVDETENGIEDIWFILEGRDYPTLVRKLTAFSPHPEDGATDVSQPIILRWFLGESALKYDIYFSEDEEAVANATTESLGIYRGRLPVKVTTYEPGSLEWNRTYYWRIDEVNETDPNSPWKGDVWSFTTANFIVVDDFESYNDLDPADPLSNRIFLAWIDGFGDSTHNGSLVHSGQRFIGHTIVHGGNQSMPFTYDNAVGRSEATLTLTDLRDWTEGGVEVLSIWFHGDPANDPEPMYVVLNNIAVVTNDNPNATQLDSWTEWRIDLQAFADQGVNLANVVSITLGLGNRTNPVSGGSGVVYFDDIRLYRPVGDEPES